MILFDLQGPVTSPALGALVNICDKVAGIIIVPGILISIFFRIKLTMHIHIDHNCDFKCSNDIMVIIL
jgi:hypothetical protein